ncbi:PDZ domain-containing protein 11 isoform X1 [Onychostoma macrolepis]|uniref:PDZ domain-containing protein 11 isoform X1 n=1 Tax=Onychostoma macrolepis TaxID=369639 RepID=UPI00272D36AD|nr:PDZ domain-containing protein 11 isoform X1 [Onychostoma macrolepis]
MLKAYVARDESNKKIKKSAHVVSTVDIIHSVTYSAYCPEQDSLEVNDAQTSCIRLPNSDILNNLELHLAHLSKEQRENVVKLIGDHSIIFSDVPQQTTMLTHDIDVGTAVPIKQHPYRVNPKKREVMRMEVEYLLQHGLAVSSKSPWSSACLLVPKSDSSLRFCTNYRKVNNITKPHSFPLPRLEDCVDRVGSSQFVTKLDLLKGYWQVPLTARASEISAFVTPDNFLQYKVMALFLEMTGYYRGGCKRCWSWSSAATGGP